MEEQWYTARSQLRVLLEVHPTWSNAELAAQLGRSVGWVKKWKRRLRAAPPDDDTVLRGLSRARKHPPPAISQVVVDRILAIRDQPPANPRPTSGGPRGPGRSSTTCTGTPSWRPAGCGCPARPARSGRS